MDARDQALARSRRTDDLIERLHRTSAARVVAQEALSAVIDSRDLAEAMRRVREICLRCEAEGLRAIEELGK